MGYHAIHMHGRGEPQIAVESFDYFLFLISIIIIIILWGDSFLFLLKESSYVGSSLLGR